MKQVRKVLCTRKAPACLLTVVYDYGKPHLCISIHHYAPPRTVLQPAGQKGVRATVVTAAHCTHTELRAMLWLAVTAVACTPASMVIN